MLGGEGMKALLCGHNDVHFKLRPLMWSFPEKMDPTGKIDQWHQRLKKIPSNKGSEKVGAGWRIG